MSNQKALIESIRRKEFGIGADLEGEAKEIVDNMVRKYRNLLSTVAEDLNSKDTHFLLELIQNADDNSYKKGVIPSLSLEMNDEYLTVKNNEIGFQEKNIRALCSAGESSKKEEKFKGYIGEKGIGFKSIFKVTNEPEIYSNGYQFKFDRSKADDLLDYVVPHWIEEPKVKIDDYTTLLIPAKPQKKFDNTYLKDISNTLLLFLQKLRIIEVHTNEKHIKYIREDNGSIITLTTMENDIQVAQQRLIKTVLSVDMSDLNEQKRQGVLATDIVLVFPIDDQNNAQPIENCETFAFLPIRSFGFNFYIQADFILASSREAIHEELEWNIRLRDQISNAFIKSIQSFKETEKLSKTYFNFIPLSEKVYDPFFSKVVEQIFDALNNENCIPTLDGSWETPNKVILSTGSFMELFTSEETLQLFKADYLEKDIELPAKIIEKIDFKTIKYSEVISILKNDLNWFESKPLDWQVRFYNFLATSNNIETYVTLLKNIPSIPCEDKEFRSCDSSTIFFPFSDNQEYGFEHELLILDSNFYKKSKELNLDKNLDILFLKLGVKKDNPYQMIKSHILAKNKNKTWKGSEHTALVGYLRYIKDKFNEYLEIGVKNGNLKSKMIEELKKELWIGTKKKENGWVFGKIENLYLSNEYNPEFNLELFLGEDADLFISPKYLEKIKSEADQIDEEDLKEWNNFFRLIGVNTLPKVLAKSDGNFVCSDELVNLLNSKDLNFCRKIIELLDQNWEFYSNKTRNIYTKKDTDFINKLRSVVVPTSFHDERILADTYMDNDQIRTIFGDDVPFVKADLKNPIFLKECNITYEVNAESCIKRLCQLRAENLTNFKQVSNIYWYLDLRWDKNETLIKNAFENNELILIKFGNSLKWVGIEQVFWEDVGNSTIELWFPSLKRQYNFQIKSFFLDKIKIRKKISVNNLIECLTKLNDLDVVSRINTAVFIYQKLDNEIHEHNNSSLQNKNIDWIGKIISKNLILNKNGNFVEKTDKIFAIDDDYIYDIFKDELIFFCAPSNKLPSLKGFMKELEIRSISEVLQLNIISNPNNQNNNPLTAKVRDMLYPIARLIYNATHKIFEESICSGLFKKISEINILDVFALHVELVVGEYKKKVAWQVAIDGSEILLDLNAKSKKDILAMEISKLFFNNTHYSSDISRLLLSKDEDEANDYLDIKKYVAIPLDEIEKLEISLGNRNITNDDIDNPESVIDYNENENFHADHLPDDFTDHVLNTIFQNEEIHLDKVETTLNQVNQLDDLTVISNFSPQIQSKKSSSFGTKSTSSQNFRKKTTTLPINKSRRLLSYAEPITDHNISEDLEEKDSTDFIKHKKQVERSAIDYFLQHTEKYWKSVDEMPPNNPGYDFTGISLDNEKEFIEIKGQSGAWTEEGVALTPMELRTADKYSERYWLCVVEYALDEARRKIWFIRNPFGNTNKFRFDRGWKDIAEKSTLNSLYPQAGLNVYIPDIGKAKIIDVIGNGKLLRLKLQLPNNDLVTKIYTPATMIVSEE